MYRPIAAAAAIVIIFVFQSFGVNWSLNWRRDTVDSEEASVCRKVTLYRHLVSHAEGYSVVVTAGAGMGVVMVLMALHLVMRKE